jgi:hypothetical protein
MEYLLDTNICIYIIKKRPVIVFDIPVGAYLQSGPPLAHLFDFKAMKNLSLILNNIHDAYVVTHDRKKGTDCKSAPAA